VIEREAGVGGMGRVYRATDLETHEPVAVKVLTHPDPSSRERFARESALLATVAHPAVVRYLTHGVTDTGSLFLVMQWLEGQSLAAILRRRILGVEEALVLGQRVAGALARAHEAGIVHRDVKPSNLLLQGDEPARVMLLDFGVARRTRDEAQLTRTGMIVGSCAYMSPEQALGHKDVDARSDLFSLGCVLYECLSGRRTFGAKDATAVLAKILLEEPPRLREIAPQLPAALDRLVMRLLAKDRQKRPSSADEVGAELAAVSSSSERVLPEPAASAPSLTSFEQRVVWVLLASGLVHATETQADTGSGYAGEDTLGDVVRSHGGSLAFLADGAAIASFQGSALPTDEAPRAARCALALRELLPHAPIAIAMGLGVVGEAPVGKVIDAAARAVRDAPPPAIRLSGISDGLLPEFEVLRDDRGLLLLGHKDAALLGSAFEAGKPGDFVGRDRDLATLEALYDASEAEPKAVAAIVTAPAGGGKSRLRQEILRRLAARDEPPTVLLGSCDVMSQSSAFAPLADAIRRRAGIGPGDTPETQRSKLVELATVVKKPARARAVAEMLGELCGVHFPDGESDALRAARRDARLMGDLLRDAFEDWLAAECEAAPVVLVLENMHWGDVPSVRFVDGALRNLSSRPLFVLALARPEITSTFPNLWAEREATALALAPLGRKFAEKLLRALGGAALDGAILDGILERAQGNAFFLEELVRAAERGMSELPESVLGTVQARLAALEPETRRVLRAASIFGERFAEEGVAELLGGEAAREAARRELRRLMELEVVSQPPDARGGEYVFRHALVQDAAYAMLTDEDKLLGHRLAGELLEARAAHEPAVLAEHFSRSDAKGRAVPHFLRAASQAMDGNDLARAVELGERALALSPSPRVAAELHALLGEALRWRGEYERSAAHGLAAMAGFEEGSERWFLAVGEYIAACAYQREFGLARPHLEKAMRVVPTEGGRTAQIVCISRGCTLLLEAGHFDEADAAIRDLVGSYVNSPDELTRGWVNWLFGMRALSEGDLGVFVVRTERCLLAFENLGQVRNTFSQRTNLGYAYAELGDFAHAEQTLRRTLADAVRVGIPMIQAYALHNLGNVLRARGELAEGMAAARRASEIARGLGDPRIEGASRGYLARMLVEAGEPGAAELEARAAIELLSRNPPLLGLARAMLARVLLARGRAADAVRESAAAAELVEAGAEDGETLIRLTLVEALLGAGDMDAARRAIAIARDRLLARAARIRDAGYRESFLQRVPESAETLRLAGALLDS